jgi:hypothetical protein
MSPKTTADKLAKLREKLKNVDTGSHGFWSPKDGRNVIRILPEVGDMKFFYQQVGRHNMPDDNKTYWYCPSFTSEGEFPCPICEMVESLYKSKDKSSRAMAGELRVRKMFWMNVIDRDNENAGPMIYTPGIQVFSAISSLINDPDYGIIYDLEDGIDLVITRKGSGLDTKYSVNPKRDSTKLHADQKVVNGWVAKAKDLSYVVVSDDPDEDRDLSAGHAVYLAPYERIEQEFTDGAPDMDDEDVEEEDTDEEPKRKPVKSTAKPASKVKPHDKEPVAKSKAKKVDDIEEDEDWRNIIDDDEEEEVEEEESAPRREISKRLKKRH